MSRAAEVSVYAAGELHVCPHDGERYRCGHCHQAPVEPMLSRACSNCGAVVARSVVPAEAPGAFAALRSALQGARLALA